MISLQENGEDVYDYYDDSWPEEDYYDDDYYYDDYYEEAYDYDDYHENEDENMIARKKNSGTGTKNTLVREKRQQAQVENKFNRKEVHDTKL